jgi:hypothetical protein
MEKKIIVSISVFLVCLIAVGGVYYFKTNRNKPIKEISVSASYKGYHSEKEMNDDAVIILYGSPVDKFEDRKFVNNYSDGFICDFYTLTKFKTIVIKYLIVRFVQC